MLAAIVSFHHILETHKIVIPREKQVNLHCNNKSVVKLVKARRESRRTVNQHRYPDMDIKLQLMFELNLLSKKISLLDIYHVKGPLINYASKSSLKTDGRHNTENQKYYKQESSSGYCKQSRLYSETEDHIIRCRVPSRRKIRNEWRK
jgi:hypothetical protein